MKNNQINTTLENAKEVKKVKDKVITLSPLGEYCQKAQAGTDKLTLSIADMAKHGVETAGLAQFMTEFYVAVNALMDIRQSTPDGEALKGAELRVKGYCQGWFFKVGTRKPKSDKDKKLRPAYGTTHADFAILGEICADIRNEKDVKNQPLAFLKAMIIATGRLLNGAPLGRVSEADITKARELAIAAQKAKAEETKNENAIKKGESAKVAKAEKAEKAELQSSVATLQVQVASYNEKMLALMNLINSSSATTEEKDAMLELVHQMLDVQSSAE